MDRRFYLDHVDWAAMESEVYESSNGEWATREDYEQLEKERDQWKREAVKMATLIKDETKYSYAREEAQAIINRHE